MPESPAYIVRIPLRIVAVLLAIVALLSFAEGLQRFVDWRERAKHADRVDPYSIRGVSHSGYPIGKYVGGQLILELTPYLLFTTQPGQQLPGLSINAQGFRGADWMLEKPAGVKRVIVVGGSTAFGKAATSDERIFSAILERMLSETARPVEVLNAGVIAFDSTQELILLSTRLLDYAPDLVVLFDGWNDFYFGGLAPRERDLGHPQMRELERVIERGQQTFVNLLRLSAFYRGLERKVPGWRHALSLDAAENREYRKFRENPQALANYRKNLERMIRLARAYGARVLVAPQPEIYRRVGKSPAHESHQRDLFVENGYADYARARYGDYIAGAGEVAAAERVDFVDCTAIFDDEGEEIFVDSVHLTDLGHEHIAECLRGPVDRALTTPSS